jgi:glycosyltransferase involved in cell wall biosynthesis
MLHAPAEPHRWTLRSLRSVILGLWPFSTLGQRVASTAEAGRKTRVLLYSHHLTIGGLERMVLSLGQALSRDSRYDVFLFSHASAENAERHTNRSLVGEFLQAGIPVDAHQKGPGLSLKTLWKLARNIHRNRIDVIHTHDLGTLIYAVLVKAVCLRRVKVVHTQHSFVHINTHKRYRSYERWFTGRTDALSVVNESLVNPYVEIGVPSRRISVVDNGVWFAEAPLRDRSDKLSRRADLLAQQSEPVRA